MKKVLLINNLAWACIIFFMTCNAIPKSEVVDNKDCYQCTNDSFYGLSAEEFIKGVARYKKTHFDKIVADSYMVSNRITNDSRACWYSLDTLKKFICLIERYSASLSPSVNSGKLGINFYYATYPHKNLWNEDYKSLHTLFMVPTIQDAQKNNVDFDPRYSMNVSQGSRVVTLSQLLESKSNFNVQLFALEGATANRGAAAFAKNQGQLCPPTCPGTSNGTLNAVANHFPGGLNWTQ